MNSFIPKGFLFPYVRFFNAAPGMGNFDFYLGNSLVAAGIPFGAFSSYLKIANGFQSFKITKTADKDNVSAQMAINFGVGEVFTICALADNDGVSLYAINEPTSRDNLQYGHLRICNLSKDCAPADVYAGDECIAADVKYLDFSKYIETVPEKYDISVKSSEDASDFFMLPSQIIKQGKYNSLYIIGQKSGSPEPRGIFTVDAASYNGFYL